MFFCFHCCHKNDVRTEINLTLTELLPHLPPFHTKKCIPLFIYKRDLILHKFRRKVSSETHWELMHVGLHSYTCHVSINLDFQVWLMQWLYKCYHFSFFFFFNLGGAAQWERAWPVHAAIFSGFRATEVFQLQLCRVSLQILWKHLVFWWIN